MKSRLIFLPFLLMALNTANGQGLIIRPDFQPTELELRRHAINAQLHEQIAVVTVEHEFYNPGATIVEGTFLFPLPTSAQVSRFSMNVDGKEMAGELLSAEEARRIYENIVRQQLDPALLEMADYRTFRARIFPIPPKATRKLILRYDANLAREGNTVTFQYPLQGNLTQRHAGDPRPLPRPILPVPFEREHARQTETVKSQQSFLRIELQTETALRNIYSPSHRVAIRQNDDRHAIVECEMTNALDGRDFLLYYSLDSNEIATTLLTHRPETGKPGYFMLLISPQVDLSDNQVQAKDLVLVLDTSGSMAGEKIEQAKAALRYCLQRLGERDRFGLVTFSSEVRLFRPTLVGITEREDALWHVDKLEATGGTNINEALLAAHKLLRDTPTARGMIIFLTDGIPSTGVQDEGQIRRNLQQANSNGVRLFPFGVGYDVNTKLLDGLGRDHHAFADYISAQENIEERVSAFYDKIHYPVMSNIAYEFRGTDVRLLSPRQLPDLFKGGQIILAGRYQQSGHASLTLRGQVGEQRQTLQYEFDFPGREREREFVARLWATRRVGDLLEDIRLNGENTELKNEVISLAKEFGLVTPYTSYLVREEETFAGDVDAQPGAFRQLESHRAPAPPREMLMKASSGAGAVATSQSIREMKEAAVVADTKSATAVVVQGRRLTLNDENVWIDGDFKPVLATVKIVFASEAYFTFLRLFPETRDFCRLGQNVIFKWQGKFVEIGKKGEKQISETEMRKLMN